jgi:crossover junction endodeoxyribonuclease RuvC
MRKGDLMTRIVGIDPGLSGALALLADAKLTDIADMPVYNKRASGRLIAETLMRWDAEYVVIEDVHSMPKQGVASSFLFGLNTGIVIGAVQASGIPMVKISSGRWKTQMGLRGKPKDASRGLAMELWPDFAEQFRLKKHDGRAEAALLARWYCHQLILGANAERPEYEEDGTVSVLRRLGGPGHRERDALGSTARYPYTPVARPGDRHPNITRDPSIIREEEQ